jgi:hypothetical protein
MAGRWLRPWLSAWTTAQRRATIFGCPPANPYSINTAGEVHGDSAPSYQIVSRETFRYDDGLAPGVVAKPPYARKYCDDEKRYPDAELEEDNHIGVVWSRRSKEAFVHCIASVRAAALGPLIPG